MKSLEVKKSLQQLANQVENIWVPSPQLKYYELGSEILDLILSNEKYYLARKERELINLYCKSIMDFGDYSSSHTIIDLGSGSGKKTFPFLEEALENFPGASYVPIDTAQTAINLCCKNVKQRFPELSVFPYPTSWEIAMSNDFYDCFHGTNITVLLLGSTIGNFSEEESSEFINKFMDIFSNLRNSRLVIMFDTAPNKSKSVEVIEDAYNIESMKTIDWHMIKMINKYFEIDIPLNKLKRCSEFDHSQKAIVRWMELIEDCKISSTATQQEVAFLAKGKRIQTEISRKYNQKDVSTISKSTNTKIWMTPDNYYMCAAFHPRSNGEKTW